jgi:hypothetical protein
MDYERAVVAEAKVHEEQRRPLFAVNAEVRSKVFDGADIVRDVGWSQWVDATLS